MPALTFSGTGITDGQIVYDNNVSQSVDAFTKAAEYAIKISGSLELTGSLFLTGSLINEYTGQFKTLGIGVVAPTEPSMLHIKTTDVGGDPVALIESTAGGDDAAVRFANNTTVYNVGLFGSLNESFRIQQSDVGGGNLKNPFIISKDVVDSTLYLYNNGIGVGLGSSTPSILAPLANNSLQTIGTLTGSLVQGNIISASWDGLSPNIINIHGTSSYAVISTTGISASYTQATSIDFSLNSPKTITQDILSSNYLSTTATSSFGRAQMGVGGITLNNTPGFSPNYKTISGSSDYLQIGDLDPNSTSNGTRLEINSISGTASILSATATKGNLLVDDTILIGSNLLISGSSTPSIQAGIANNSSQAFSKLTTNTLQANSKFNFNIYNFVNKIGGSGTGTMALSVGADAIESNIGVYISQSNIPVSAFVSQSSFPVIPNNSLILTGASPPTDNTYVNINKKVGAINGYFVGIFGNPDYDVFNGVFGQQIWRLQNSFQTTVISQRTVPVLNLNPSSPGFDGTIRRIYNFKVSMIGVAGSTSTGGIITATSTWIFRPQQPIRWIQVLNSHPPGGDDTIIKVRGNTPYFSAVSFSFNLGTTSTADDSLIFNLILPASTPASDWSGKVEVDMLTNKNF
tara:strand:- start:2015 stop:3910 length:1896 start_codon:yes stop_codon:yes gene_type:complete